VAEPEKVREVGTRMRGNVVDVLVGPQRRDVIESEPGRIDEVGTEAIDAQAVETDRRRQMREQRRQPRHPLVLARRLAGKAPNQIPQRGHAEFLAPLQYL